MLGRDSRAAELAVCGQHFVRSVRRLLGCLTKAQFVLYSAYQIRLFAEVPRQRAKSAVTAVWPLAWPTRLPHTPFAVRLASCGASAACEAWRLLRGQDGVSVQARQIGGRQQMTLVVGYEGAWG
jgi:hypothetical protein